MPMPLQPHKVNSPLAPDSATMARFLDHCHRRRYPSRTDVFRPGSAATCLYYVVSGSLSVVSEEADGRELILGEETCLELPDRKTVEEWQWDGLERKLGVDLVSFPELRLPGAPRPREAKREARQEEYEEESEEAPEDEYEEEPEEEEEEQPRRRRRAS